MQRVATDVSLKHYNPASYRDSLQNTEPSSAPVQRQYDRYETLQLARVGRNAVTLAHPHHDLIMMIMSLK